VARLPLHVLEKIGVKSIRERGILHKDKEVEELKLERAAEKHERRTAVPLTMDEFKEKAASTTVGNDLLWEDPAIV
jgi:hypothetical protein